MQRYKQPRTTYIEYLTHDNFYLNERNVELSKMCENYKKNIDYTNKFFYSIYDISGSYLPNIKIVVYDSSNDILTYICSDSSGAFSPTVELDLSTNTLQNTMRQTDEHIGNFKQQDEDSDKEIHDMSRGFPFWHHHFHPYPGPYPYPYPYPYPGPYPGPYPYPPYPFDPYSLRDNTESQDQPNKITTGNSRIIAEKLDRGITNGDVFKTQPVKVTHSTSVNGIMKTTCDASRCCLSPYPYPYLYGLPYPYPYYDLLDNDDDYRSILDDISFNHPIRPMPEYPVIRPPVEQPIIHRDIKEISEQSVDFDRFPGEDCREISRELYIYNRPHPHPHHQPHHQPHHHQPYPRPRPQPNHHPSHKYTNGM